MIEEATEKVGFWILGGVGSACVLIGWIWSRKMGWESLPFWQVLVLLIVIWVASVFFASKD